MQTLFFDLDIVKACDMTYARRSYIVRTSSLFLQFSRTREGKCLGITVASVCGLFLLGGTMRPVGLIFRHVVGRDKSVD
jgi:hypothetical protein